MFSFVGTACYYYGPGFSSSEILESGIDKFISQINPDIIIVSDLYLCLDLELKYYPGDLTQKIYGLRRLLTRETTENLFVNWEYNCDVLMGKDKSLSHIPRVFTIFDTEHYRITGEHVKRMSTADYIISIGKEFLCSIRDMPKLHKESFASKCNDNLYDFVSE